MWKGVHGCVYSKSYDEGPTFGGRELLSSEVIEGVLIQSAWKRQTEAEEAPEMLMHRGEACEDTGEDAA